MSIHMSIHTCLYTGASTELACLDTCLYPCLHTCSCTFRIHVYTHLYTHVYAHVPHVFTVLFDFRLATATGLGPLAAKTAHRGSGADVDFQYDKRRKTYRNTDVVYCEILANKPKNQFYVLCMSLCNIRRRPPRQEAMFLGLGKPDGPAMVYPDGPAIIRWPFPLSS